MRWLLAFFSLAGLMAGVALTTADEVKKADVPKLIKQLKSGIAKARAAAAQDLGERGAIRASDVKDAIPSLLELVKNDKDAGVRKAAALALGKIDPDPKDAVPVLMDALKDKVMSVRVAAAQALGEIGPGAKEAVPALRELQREKDKDKRELSRAAGMALRNINSK